MTSVGTDSKGLTGKIAALAAFLVALSALVDAAIGLVTKTRPIACGLILSLPWCSGHSELPIPNLPIGASGWIYVGTRIGAEWKTSDAEGIEPALTIDTDGLPTRGSTYTVIRGVNLRDGLPKEGAGKPVMSDSRGAITVGSLVKLGDVQEIKLDKPTRMWIWAHATLVERP
jgi:hypothetical protein